MKCLDVTVGPYVPLEISNHNLNSHKNATTLLYKQLILLFRNFGYFPLICSYWRVHVFAVARCIPSINTFGRRLPGLRSCLLRF